MSSFCEALRPVMAVLETQIGLAADNGLSFFAFCRWFITVI